MTIDHPLLQILPPLSLAILGPVGASTWIGFRAGRQGTSLLKAWLRSWHLGIAIAGAAALAYSLVASLIAPTADEEFGPVLTAVLMAAVFGWAAIILGCLPSLLTTFLSRHFGTQARVREALAQTEATDEAVVSS